MIDLIFTHHTAAYSTSQLKAEPLQLYCIEIISVLTSCVCFRSPGTHGLSPLLGFHFLPEGGCGKNV